MHQKFSVAANFFIPDKELLNRTVITTQICCWTDSYSKSTQSSSKYLLSQWKCGSHIPREPFSYCHLVLHRQRIRQSSVVLNNIEGLADSPVTKWFWRINDLLCRPENSLQMGSSWRHGQGDGGAGGAPHAAEWVLAAAQIDSIRYHIQMWCLCVLEDWGSTRWLLFKFSSWIHQFWHKCSLLRGNSVMFPPKLLWYF